MTPTLCNTHGFRNSHLQQNRTQSCPKKYPFCVMIQIRSKAIRGERKTQRFVLKKYISIKTPITISAVNAVQGVSSAMLMATNA